MTLSRKTSRIYMDEFDLNGAARAGYDRAEKCEDERLTLLYLGASMALQVIADSDHIETQEVFWKLFDNMEI